MRTNDGPQIFDGTDAQQIIAPKMVAFWNGSGSTIPAGSAVQIDISVLTFGLGTAVKIAAATAAAARLIIGATSQDLANLAWGLIQVGGIQNNVSVITATAADIMLIGSVTTAGRLIVSAAAAGEVPVARSLSVAASNLATVMWLNTAGL